MARDHLVPWPGVDHDLPTAGIGADDQQAIFVKQGASIEIKSQK